MGGGHQVNIVDPLGNQLLVNFLEPGHRNFFAVVQAAYFVVLAKTAVQVTAAKKNGAAAFRAADHGFFPQMQGGPGHDGQHTAMAGTV